MTERQRATILTGVYIIAILYLADLGSNDIVLALQVLMSVGAIVVACALAVGLIVFMRRIV